MSEPLKLKDPWMVAVWPGMGHVALNAGIYLLSKMEMTVVAEFEAPDLFDIDHVEVKDGLVQPARRPRNRFFVWKDPNERHDLVVFLGEAQPPIGRYPFCRQLIQYAKELGVGRIFTFAAMATQMDPTHESRVFAAATDEANLNEMKRLELTVLEDGNIGGLNGVLLGAAAEAGLQGTCLLGEMPHIFAQIPYPKASLAILEVFATLASLDLNLDELADQARIMDEKLGDLLARAEEAEGESAPDEEEGQITEAAAPEPVAESERKHIEDLFLQAGQDRSKAFELKRELDRLGLFREYENRFLDLFKKAES